MTVHILDVYNGRTTSMVSEEDNGTYSFNWLLMGQAESADLWVNLPVNFDEAQRLIDDPPVLYEPYIDALSPRDIKFTLEYDGDEMASATVNTGQTKTPFKDAFAVLAYQLGLATAKNKLSLDDGQRLLALLTQQSANWS